MEFIVELPERLIKKFEYDECSSAFPILADAIYDRQEKKYLIPSFDLAKAGESILYVDQLGVGMDEKGGTKNIIEYVNEGTNRYFLGTPPSEEDEYEQFAVFSFLFKPFNDLPKGHMALGATWLRSAQ